jgi:hypothetical protein
MYKFWKIENFLHEIQVIYLLNQNSLNMRRRYIVYIGLWPRPEKVFTKYRISLNVGTLNQGYSILVFS